MPFIPSTCDGEVELQFVKYFVLILFFDQKDILAVLRRGCVSTRSVFVNVFLRQLDLVVRKYRINWSHT